MSRARTTAHTAAVYALIARGPSKMPQALIVIFLLFFAVLAFAWFYLQRAKARTPAAESTDAASATPAMAASAPAADATYASRRTPATITTITTTKTTPATTTDRCPRVA